MAPRNVRTSEGYNAVSLHTRSSTISETPMVRNVYTPSFHSALQHPVLPGMKKRPRWYHFGTFLSMRSVSENRPMMLLRRQALEQYVRFNEMEAAYVSFHGHQSRSLCTSILERFNTSFPTFCANLLPNCGTVALQNGCLVSFPNPYSVIPELGSPSEAVELLATGDSTEKSSLLDVFLSA
jgi:hypothetical protein